MTADELKALDKEVAAFKKTGKTPEEIAEFVAAQEHAATEAAKKAGNSTRFFSPKQ